MVLREKSPLGLAPYSPTPKNKKNKFYTGISFFFFFFGWGSMVLMAGRDIKCNFCAVA